jgi:hypothetical protein
MTFKVRRIITSHNAQGKAVVGIDDVVESRPGIMDKNVSNAFVWSTASMPCDANQPDPRLGKIELAPGRDGTIFRVLELPPGCPAHMHKTETVDYVIMLEGECDMILDDGAEVHMNQGDMMVQNATYHGWTNRSSKPCKIVFVLMDAKKR